MTPITYVKRLSDGVVMEERGDLQKNVLVLIRKEGGVLLRLMELLFARQLGRILETLVLYFRRTRAGFVAV